MSMSITVTCFQFSPDPFSVTDCNWSSAASTRILSLPNNVISLLQCFAPFLYITRRDFIYSLRSFSYWLGVKLHGKKELT